MSDEFGSVEVTTNGKHGVTDPDPWKPDEEPPQSILADSVDERLDALRRTIRTWDWRATSAETYPPSPDVATSTVPPVTAAAFREAQADPEYPRGDVTQVPRSVDLSQDPITASPPEAPENHEPAQGPTTVHAPPVVVEPATASTAVIGTTTIDAPADDHDTTHDASTSWFETVPEQQPEPGRHPRRWPPRGRIRVAALCVAAVVVVVGIIGGIRLANKNPNSGAVTTTTVARTATTTDQQPPKVAPISAAQLTQYEGYAEGLQKANNTATKGFVGAGSTPTASQIAAVVTAYRAALNLYDFQLHFIQWPASMQTAIAVDHAQFQALMGFLQSYAAVSPAGISAWLSQLHNRTGTTETADNQVRLDLGLSRSTSFP